MASGAVTLVAAQPAAAFPTGAIADKAETYTTGSHGGQCIVFVADVLSSVSSGSINISAYSHGYQGTFSANGAGLITGANAAVRGDVIQVTPPGTSDSWGSNQEFAMPLHTAIIRQNLGGGSFRVVDSNWSSTNDELIRRHDFNPYTWVASYGGGTVKIWRFGTTDPPPPPPPGKDSTGAYLPWDGTFHLSNLLESGPSNYSFEKGSSVKVGRKRIYSVPVTGDWNGDGKDSTGAYFPWDGTFHLSNLLRSGPSNYSFEKGTSVKVGRKRIYSVPVTGDWDDQ